MLKDTIKKLRTEQGLSQDELAERVHVVRQTVSKWERGTSVPDADSLVALARALGVSAAELLGESAMVEKKPDDLAWETSLLDERIASESQRLDRLVRALKWALVGAAVMVLVFGLFIWLPNQQFSYTIWWDSVTDDPDYNKIIYRLDGEGKSIRLFLDPEDYGRVIGCAGEPGMAEASCGFPPPVAKTMILPMTMCLTQFASTPIPTTKISHGHDLGFCSFRS